MKLTSFDLYRYELPFSVPLTLGGEGWRHRDGLLLKLTGEDGREGWGETAPLPGFSRESVEEAVVQLRDLAGSMVGREEAIGPTDPNGDFGRELDRRDLAPSVRFGFELAVWNLLATSTGKTLAELLSDDPGTEVPVNGLLSGSPDEVLEEARWMRNTGYRAVKLKVGGRTVEEDVGLVRALNEALGDGVSLRLDANRAWGFEEAVGFARGVAEVPFEYVEEPLADPARLPELAGYGLPVALDESLVGMGVGELEGHDYARAVVLKPTLIGGISRTLRFADGALRLGMTPVVSSAYESGVGTAALISLAAGIGDEAVPAGLDTYRRLARDVLRTPLDLPAPTVEVGRASDAARKPDPKRLIPVPRP